jgi:hypothetical protein
MSELNLATDSATDDELLPEQPAYEDAEVAPVEDAAHAQAAADTAAQDKAALKADAVSRSLRSLAQGAVVAVAESAAYEVYKTYEGGQHNWHVLALVAVQAALTAGASFLHKRFGK